MKKTFLSKIPMLGLILAGVFLFSSANNLVAQQTTEVTDQLFVQPIGPFVSPSVAIQQLNLEISGVKNGMAALTPGTFAYKQLEAKYEYFNTILNYIVGGKSVAQSIVDAVEVMAADSYNLSRDTLLDYKEEAINFLKL